MKINFLYFCYGLLLTLLYAVYVAGTALAYWTPLRDARDMPFTISPIEWTTVYAYIAALVLTAAGIYFYPPAHLKHLWLGTSLCAAVFAVSGWGAEYAFYFNAHDAEKEEGIPIILGCLAILICCGAMASLFWTIRDRLIGQGS